MLPLSCHQEPWVLQSASADQPHPPAGVAVTAEAEAAAQLLHQGLNNPEAATTVWGAARLANPANLVLARTIN